VPTITYTYQFPYGYSPQGRPFPILSLRLLNPTDTALSVEVAAYLDSGTDRSLFDGTLTHALGIDLLRGKRITFLSTGGTGIGAFLHPVKISHADLGQFDLDVAFSSVALARNLLGRDFFNLVQVGFREHHLVFYVTPEP
jgi:hypothetical protein